MPPNALDLVELPRSEDDGPDEQKGLWIICWPDTLVSLRIWSKSQLPVLFGPVCYRLMRIQTAGRKRLRRRFDVFEDCSAELVVRWAVLFS
jgi:hypothetical protein